MVKKRASELQTPQRGAHEPPRQKVGTVTASERDEIRTLFERKNGLTELFRSLVGARPGSIQNTEIYDRLVSDIGDVSTRFQRWWDDKSRHYGWPSKPGHSWEIDFETCSIFLRRSD